MRRELKVDRDEHAGDGVDTADGMDAGTVNLLQRGVVFITTAADRAGVNTTETEPLGGGVVQALQGAEGAVRRPLNWVAEK